jgi:TadE-like protein
VRSRQNSQAVVEFGVLALMFVLLMFAVVDLGLLLNSWVRLSAATREIGRAATVGYNGDSLEEMGRALVLPGVSHTMFGPFSGYCCGPNDKIVLTIDYYNGDPTVACIPGGASPCTPLPASSVDDYYWGGGTHCTGRPSTPCAGLHPLRGDIIVVSLAAPGMEVVTPLVRPFFGCGSSDAHCTVRLGSTAMMRYENTQ